MPRRSQAAAAPAQLASEVASMANRSPGPHPRRTARALVAVAPRTGAQPALAALWLTASAVAVALGAALTGIVIAVR